MLPSRNVCGIYFDGSSLKGGKDTIAHTIKALLHLLTANGDALRTIAATASLTVLLFKGWPKLIVRWREKRSKRQLQMKLNSEDYTLDDIERAVTFYVDPECQVVDPSGSEDFRRIYPVRQNLFDVIDELLSKQTVSKFSLLLADTGMGKTSFLLNYFARHRQGARRPFSIAIIALGAGGAEEKIAAIPNKPGTVLFFGRT